jgi:hypothetical protein
MNDFDKIVQQCCSFEVVYPNIDQVSEKEYQQIRQDWLGASDSSKLLNLNPFPNSTREDLIQEKVTGTFDESIGLKASVRMGKDIEEVILKKVQEFFSEDGYTVDKPKDMYGDPESGLGINFDSLAIYSDFIAFPVEIKAVTKYGRKYYDFNKSEYYQKEGKWQPKREVKLNTHIPANHYTELAHEYGIPLYYYTQLQQQMMAVNASIGYLAALDVDNWDLHLFRIHRNDCLWSDLKLLGKETTLKIRTMRKLKEEKGTE